MVERIELGAADDTPAAQQALGGQSVSPVRAASRRDFVKASSAIVAGGAAMVSGLSIARSAHIVGDDRLKIALVGCGGRGRGAVVEALRTEGKVTLWALADAFESSVRNILPRIERDLADGYDEKKMGPRGERIDVPAERQFSGLDAYQKAIDSGVDVVLLTTPPGFRPIHFAAAVAAGKHVFMEKPVAVDAPGVRKVLAAGAEAKSKGLAVGVGLQRRHDPSYIETIDRLQNGAIGDILLTRVYWNGEGVWVRNRAKFIETHGHEPTEMEYQVNNWYYFNWLCGDHIAEQHIHNLDVSNWLKNAHPVEAGGMGGRQVRTGKDYGQIFDHHFIEFTYADGCTMMSQCRHMRGTTYRGGELATGSAGTADIDGALIHSPQGKWNYQGDRGRPTQREHDDLFAAIRRGEPYNESEYGATSTMTAILGRMATYSGKVIRWDEAFNSNIDLSPGVYDFAADPPVMPDADGNYPVPVPGKSVVV
ncbi:MAG: Gfo/Idh/MocA family oxidoreductase [Pirellulales bacterium]|nr:Gfo/Idh/MocA family oxidoreductase [Pirellulales bacterium]